MRNRRLEHVLSRHPRGLNLLHRLGLVQAVSQTNETELAALGKYSIGMHVAAEIGSFQGVSAAIIAANIDNGGKLYCVDPWLDHNGRTDPCRSIFERHTRRRGVRDRIEVLRGFSRDVAKDIPSPLDFVFVDGDHSLGGIAFDWALIKQKLRHGGIACLHDVYVPQQEPWRRFDSVDFYERSIRRDPEFLIIEQVHSMAVLRRS